MKGGTRALLELTVGKYETVEFPDNMAIGFDVVRYECGEKCGHEHAALRVRIFQIPADEVPTDKPPLAEPRQMSGNETVLSTVLIAACNLESFHRYVTEVVSEGLYLDAAVYRLAVANQKHQ